MSYIGNSSTLYDPTRSSPKTAQVFSGNGSTTTFNLTYGVATSSDIQVMVENVVQQPDYAYTATGQVLTFSAAPNPGTNNIYVVYNRTAGLTGSVSDGSISSSKLANNIRLLATDQFLGTGYTTQFALSDSPADANSLIVSINGVLQAAPTNYTIAGNILTFSSAPLLNENIIIRNVGFRTTQTLYALGANTPIVQPVITGGSYTLAGTLSATGNVSLLNASGASYTANIGGTTGNLIVQSANNISVQVGGNTSATFTPTGITANLNGYVANTNITGKINATQGGTGLTSPGTTGNVLTSNGTTWNSTAPANPGYTAGLGGQAFTSSGTFTIPSGVTALKVTVVGGGGSGGASGYTSGYGGSSSSVSSGSQSISTITGGGGNGGYGGQGAGGSSSGGTINTTGGNGLQAAGGGSLFGGGGYGSGVSGTLGGGGGGNTSPSGGAGGGAISYLTGLTAGGTLSVTIGAGGSSSGGGSGAGGDGIVVFEW